MSNIGNLPLPAEAREALGGIVLEEISVKPGDAFAERARAAGFGFDEQAVCEVCGDLWLNCANRGEHSHIAEAVDPNVGGGVDRDKLPASDFVFSDERVFPVVTPGDVSDAVSSWGRYKGPHSFDDFKSRLMALAKRKGAAFVAELPKAWREAEVSEFIGDCIPLQERAVAKDGTVSIKIIQPGWNMSNPSRYYPAEILRRDGATAFPSGTHMYWNHPTESEQSERPEGDLCNLAAVFVSNPAYDDAGPDGPGSYVKAKAFGEYKHALQELAPHIGVSINAGGYAVDGEVEGREGKIVTELLPVRPLSSSKSMAASTVDFVTRPSAGGHILQLFEGAGRVAPAELMRETNEMNEEKLTQAEARIVELEAQVATQVEEAKTKDAEIAQFHESALLGKAVLAVGEALAATKLPDVTKTRLSDMLTANPPILDGELDAVAYAETITEAITAAEAEVAAIVGTGKIVGMGAATKPDAKATLREEWTSYYRAQGHSAEESAKLAAFAVKG